MSAADAKATGSFVATPKRNARRIRATIMNAAHISAARLPRATQLADPGAPAAAMPARPVASTAAVAESAPTTRCLDEPKNANAANSKHDFLTDALFFVAAVETCSQFAVAVSILFDVGVH